MYLSSESMQLNSLSNSGYDMYDVEHSSLHPHVCDIGLRASPHVALKVTVMCSASNA